MEHMLIALGILSVLELLLFLPGVWSQRKLLSSLVLAALLAVTIWLLIGSNLQAWVLIICVINLYRTINLLRLVKGRAQADYLFRAVLGASIRLIGLQLMIAGIAVIGHHFHASAEAWWRIAFTLEFAFSIILVTSTWRHLRTIRPPALPKSYADKELPSLTVAIPARNETTDLEECLRSLTLSTYPKLEILVLDDCSADKRTPGIIRDFAQAGVRFISGEEPPKYWLAKNFAYHQLAHEANGELLLFCGVDARFEPDSLRILVETLLEKQKTMLSVLPRNVLPNPIHFGSLLVQPSRYAWELALPRRWFNRPPVLSTCWLITTDLLHSAGGFEAVSRSGSPESYFAARAAHTNDGYSFVSSNAAIGLQSTKSFSEQRATAIRTRYPQLHRRLELVVLFGAIELLGLVGPFAVLIVALLGQYWMLAGLSGLSCLLLIAFYARIVSLTYRRFLLRGLWLLPFATFYDLGLLHYSMWQYEFSEVIWKGRNVCIPVMRAAPDLQSIENHTKVG